MYKPTERHYLYSNYAYQRRQMRDTLEGATAVKNSGELYLPMPSSMLTVDVAPSVSHSPSVNNRKKMMPDYLPWNHSNPAYRAYLQRARFPDITANSLRATCGIGTKNPPETELPKPIAYLEEEVSKDGESLEEFFGYLLTEILSVGNVNIIVDVDTTTNEFYLTSYTAESSINWDLKRVRGAEKILAASFLENDIFDFESDEVVKEFCLNDDGFPVTREYINGDQDGEEVPLAYRGKAFTRVPVFPVGSVENTMRPNVIPLLGISDIAIEIYQENADLRQAHFLTCNPTLFIFGIQQKEVPQTVGSQVIVGVGNPDGHAEYPATDTSALDHIRQCKTDLFAEAASYGANFLTSGAKESGEALNVRQANRGANLIHCINMVSKALRDALIFIADMKGATGDLIFEGNTEFAEMILNAQDINSLVAGWLSGAIDHDTLLDNLRDAGYVKGDLTNDQIKAKILNAAPAVSDEPIDDPVNDDPNKKDTPENEDDQ